MTTSPGRFAAVSADLTISSLQQELQEAENALLENERKRVALTTSATDDARPEPLAVRLTRLETTANDLLLTQHIGDWKKQYEQQYDKSLLEEVLQLESLQDILLQVDESSETYERLVQDDFLPYCDYVYDELILSLRRLLQQADYPSSEGCHELLDQKGIEGTQFAELVEICDAIVRLASAQQQVVQHVGLDDASLDANAVLREFCRPFVERVDFHFIRQTSDEPRPTTNRLDRLPEWVCSYLKEHAFEGGPWDLVQAIYASSPSYCSQLPLGFMNEIVRLVQWVFGERNFFRHTVISGPDSKPIHLMAAIEQFMRFDEYTQSLFGHATGRLLKLMDVFIGGEDELLGWWLEREREYVFSTLFHEPVTTSLVSRVSPRAELFCSIIRSIQCKADVFSFSGPYLSHVAAPLCMQFVDAVDESSASLRAQLGGRELPSNSALEANVNEWIELINGTHMAALILCVDDDEYGGAAMGGSQDLVRFGRSLQSLEGVLLDEFAKIMVGTVLMERSKLASYLVRCSHLLSCDEAELAEIQTQSSDLVQSRRVLSTFLAVCDNTTRVDNADDADAMARSQYAPRLMKEKVLDLLAGKILELALNWDDMSPDLQPAGCKIFAGDIESLFGLALLPTIVLRLLDIVRLMAMTSVPLSQLGDALCGLVGQPAPLELDYFTVDDKLYEEAISMIQAKGLTWVELADVLNILNRRRDLLPRLSY